VKLSVIIATRNRARAITPCLASIATAFAKAAPLDAEIVIVDNGSIDNTREIIAAWASTSGVPVRLLSEPCTGKARALNLALTAAQGVLLAFTDDDCRLHGEYVNDLLRHDAADTGLVFRGGCIELGDPADLPFTINTSPTLRRWSLAANSARTENLADHIAGCNTTMRRALAEKIGPFDEAFGPGSYIESGEDTDTLFRAYLAGATLEYVPDMTVFHHHGRKTNAAAAGVIRRYVTGSGGLYVKYLFKHPNLCRQFYWDSKAALKEIVTGTNTFLPDIGFSHKDKVACSIRGAVKYLTRPRRSKKTP
jgi:glycosyltransferase involved in cell wall biosynthesis